MTSLLTCAARPGRPGAARHRSNAPRFGLDHERGVAARPATPATGRSVDVRNTLPSASQNATSMREAHPERVHAAARPEHERALDAVATEQAATTAAGAVGDLHRGQHVTVAHEPTHRNAQSHVETDLEHVAVDDFVVFAFDAQLALLLGLGPRAPMSSSSRQKITSARMNPRWRSEWITPAHSGALAPARNVHARDSVSPVVRNVRRPSRWYAARATRGTTPSPRPRPSSSSVRSSGSSRAASASSWRQTASASSPSAELRNGRHELVGLLELVFADVDDDQHRLGRDEERGRQVLALLGE